jgi:glucose-1-phosphate cytidylyltransferase
MNFLIGWRLCNLKVVILAGGYGSRITEESHLIPKPMIEIGRRPILWHIMKYYSTFGHNDFVILAGYKQHVIKEYFSNYFLHQSDVTFDLSNKNTYQVHSTQSEPWKVTILDTGLETMTAGRLLRAKKLLNERFLLTYGDGLSDVDINELIKTHERNLSVVTITAIKPEGRFGVLSLKGDEVTSFREKNNNDTAWINGGFMVVEPEIFEYIDGDHSILEREPFDRLVNHKKIHSYFHNGFWQCMDTMRDKEKLDEMLESSNAKWVIWND